MKTIPLADALSFADERFPLGPEALAGHLSVNVRYSALRGCDGWCLSAGDNTVVRVNSMVAKSRQRFTLAHELGHLLLGIPSVIGESFYDMFRPDDAEERNVNDIAAQLLLPRRIVRQNMVDLPVDASGLCRLAKKASVSELVTALRIADLAEELGLKNASVLFFRENVFGWQWPRTIEGITSRIAAKLLERARESSPNPFRHQVEFTDETIVASLIENPLFDSATLLVQELTREQGNRLSRDERRRELEDYLFQDDIGFQRSLQGCFGAFKPKVGGLPIEKALDLFWECYTSRFPGDAGKRLSSSQGKEYVRLRLEEWCRVP